MSTNESSSVSNQDRRDFIKTGGTFVAAFLAQAALPASARAVVAQLEENVKIAREFAPLSVQQLAAMSDKAEPVSMQPLFFRFLKRA